MATLREIRAKVSDLTSDSLETIAELVCDLEYKVEALELVIEGLEDEVAELRVSA